MGFLSFAVLMVIAFSIPASWPFLQRTVFAFCVGVAVAKLEQRVSKFVY